MTSGRSYGGERPEDRASRRRRQLLDAGLELFGTVGYRRSTVRAICREARVADRTFYEEFSSTEDLLLAVYGECVDRLAAAVLNATRDLHDPPTLAHDGLDAFFATVEADPRLARVVWSAVVGVSPQVEAAYLERMTTFGEMLFALMAQRGIETRQEPAESRVLMGALVGGISQTVLTWIQDDFQPPRPRLVRPLAALLLAGVEVSLDTT